MKWQNPIKEGHQKNVEALTRINKLLEVTKLTPEQRTEAMLLIDKAGRNHQTGPGRRFLGCACLQLHETAC